MKFVEKFELSMRGAVDPMPPERVDGTLLVSEKPIAKWDDNHNAFGHDYCSLYSAYADGERAWLLRETWCAAFGYSASGTREQIIPFDEGIKLIIEHGNWDIFFETQE